MSGTGSSVRREMLAIAWPIMLSNLVVVILAANDTVILGRAGAQTVAAAGVAAAVHIVMMAVVSGFALPAQVMTARLRGAGDELGAARAATAAGLVAMGIAVVELVAVEIFAHRVCALILSDAADAELVDVSTGYLRIVAIAVLFQAIAVPLRGFVSGMGTTRIMLVAAVAASAVDVAGGYGALALGFTPEGVAASTVAGIATSALVLVVWSRRQSVDGPVPGPVHLAHARTYVRDALSMGAPEALQGAFGTGAALVTTALLAPFGEVALAAGRGLESILSLLWVATAGWGAAVTTLVGRSLGAGGGPHDVRAIEKQAWRSALPIAVAIAIALALSTHVLVRVLIDDPAVADAAGDVAWLAWSQVPLMVAGMLIGAVIRAHKDSTTGLVASLLAEYAGFLPLGIWWVRHQDLGLTGIQYAHLGYWAIFLAILIARRARLLARDERGVRA